MMKLREKYRAILNKKERKRIKAKMVETFGLSKVTISAWLSAQRPVPERYHKAIAEIFGCEVNEIF